MKKFSIVVSLAMLVAFFTGCMTNPVTGRKQLSLVSPQETMQLGLTAFEQMKQEVPISKDPAANALVQRVGKRIAAVADKDMPNAAWEFVVFESPEPNAFCLPGGKIGVHTGILPITQNEEGLATVIGHEVAHATSQHAAERISEGMLLETGSQVAGALTSSAKPITQNVVAAAFGLGGPLLVQLPHSRKQELEADHVGLIYMARAGYNPEAAIQFWQRFSAATARSGGGTPTFLRTHPVDSDRIENIRKFLPEAKRQQALGPAGAELPTLAPSPTRGTPTGSQIIGRPR